MLQDNHDDDDDDDDDNNNNIKLNTNVLHNAFIF
jgi:hypothetical protein